MKKIYPCHFDSLDNLPLVRAVEERLGVALNHGDIVNFSSDRYGSAFFVRQNGEEKEWVANPDISGAGHLTVPREITANMEDAIMEYSDVMSELDTSFTAIYLSEDDVYLRRYPSIRRSDEHTWSHKGFEVVEGREKPTKYLLVFTEEYGPVLHVKTQKAYVMRRDYSD